MKVTHLLLVLAGFAFLTSCNNSQSDLPILGKHDYTSEFIDGELVNDTIFYTISNFSFTDQNGEEFTEKDIEGKIYVTDFFFTSCPTICPKMSKNMLEIANKYEGNDQLVFVSHSIDTRHDSVPVLKKYANKLNAPLNWKFVTGEKKHIFDMAENYMVSASEDEHAPGGVIHSGAFILIDQNRQIRAYYDGTKDEDMPKLLNDIEWLLENP